MKALWSFLAACIRALAWLVDWARRRLPAEVVPLDAWWVKAQLEPDGVSFRWVMDHSTRVTGFVFLALERGAIVHSVKVRSDEQLLAPCPLELLELLELPTLKPGDMLRVVVSGSGWCRMRPVGVEIR